MNNDMQLLNYMYQQGYTEEDMYDERTITKVRFSYDYIAYKIRVALASAFIKLQAVVKQAWERVKVIVKEYDEWQESFAFEKARLPALDFERAPIRNQVLCNKPRNQVRKIIR
ncbi:hypothetical protein ACQKDB_15970 [Planococcus kocurii]|uniref:hypothetical protein n=1 Tax=Planococcus kocurii TaxID=1374 RepID=UPI003D03C5CF